MTVDVPPFLQGVDNGSDELQMVVENDVVIDGLNMVSFSLNILQGDVLLCYLEIGDELCDFNINVVMGHKEVLQQSTMIEVHNCTSQPQSL